MKYYPTNHIKNVALIGGSKSGKTSLAECMMFEGGVLSRMGSVEQGNTVSDYHEIELDRGTSVFSSILHTEWRGNKINLIDTPGLDDFIGEVVSTLRICDTALVVLNASRGVEVGTEIHWRYLRRYNKPSIFVVNQVDHPKSNFESTVEQAKSTFGDGVVVMQYPYNEGENFNCIIDLLKMTMYKFPEAGGKPEKLPIPDEERERANELHNILVEAAAEHDDDLMELYFEKGELDEDELRKGLRLGMLARTLFPVFCLSAAQNMGSGRLMGFLGNVAPSAGDTGPERTQDGDELLVTDDNTTLLVFKASHEKHTGAMSYFKVCSGEVQAGMEFYNPNAHSKFKLSQLYTVDGKRRHQVDKLAAGDIGATMKLKDTHVNHTLRNVDDNVMLEPIVFPEPKIRTAIEVARQGDDEKLAQALHKMAASDPTLVHEYAKEIKQSLLQGQGELHLQTTKWNLKNVYGVEIDFIEPKISYRETITKQANGYYKHKKQSGGAGQYAEVKLIARSYTGDDNPHPQDIKVRGTDVHQLPWGGKLLFHNCIVGGVIDSRFMPAILKGIMELMEEGPITQSPARDIEVYIIDGKMHAVDSNEISFKIAGGHAFKEAFMNAGPKVMEPIYRVEILVPDDFMGDVMTDLQGRRGIVEGFTSEGAYQKITARIPLAEMNRYNTSLSSLSQGRATFTRRFLEYAPTPGEVQAKLIASASGEMVS
ncbi:MAG: elongation factor G [Bacteroidota bacterium]